MTSLITEDSKREFAGCEDTENPKPGCAPVEIAMPVGRDGTAAAMTFLTGNILNGTGPDESEEPVLLLRSPCSPSPLLPLLPTAGTTGANAVPDNRHYQIH